MPCYDDRNNSPVHTVSAVESLLCEAVDLIEALGALSRCSSSLQTWAKDHEAGEIDRIREGAIAKLSAKEQRALGLAPTLPSGKTRRRAK